MYTIKMTASNTKILMAIKRRFNAKIYKKALTIYNTEGKVAALKYVQQFTTSDIGTVLAN